MKAIRLDGRYLLRLVRGEEVMESLRAFVRIRTLPGATLTGLGAADAVTVGFYDLEAKAYRPRSYEGRIEVASLTGNIAWHGSEPVVHVHISAVEEESGSFGGHLLQARVSATMEISVFPFSSRLTRAVDEPIGLPLLDLPDTDGT